MTSRDPREPVERPTPEALKLRSVLYDRATGLPAYALLFDDLRAHLEHRRRLGVVHVEIANLDLVESLYGWQVFDRILGRVASLLREAVGGLLPADTLLGINGVAGDRFVAFVRDSAGGREVDGETLERIDAGLRAVLEAALDDDDLAGVGPRLELRTGHALLSEDPFYRFERRVYAAVDEARTMSARRHERHEQSRSAELKRIIKRAAVSTVFQPVVDLGTREVFGFEALARGPKDTFFEMPRAMFALSTHVGVAADLDRLCRDTALRECRDVARRGKVFVNVLAGSLDDPGWPGPGVSALLEEAHLGPDDLVIEVSERSTDHDVEQLAAVLERIKDHGFGLALDDIGTGYATLATLERVRPHYLKIDVSMVRDIHRNLIKQELLSSLVHIAHRIGASVIAEGVESEDEATTLLAAGARYAQGFLFAGPASAAEVAGPGGYGPDPAAEVR